MRKRPTRSRPWLVGIHVKACSYKGPIMAATDLLTCTNDAGGIIPTAEQRAMPISVAAVLLPQRSVTAT